MNPFADSFEKFADIQKQSFEPARKFTVAAVDAFESVARTNYAVIGDLLEYTVEQAKLPTAVEPGEYFERQMAHTRAFAETMSKRANEYVELGKSLQATAEEVINTDLFEKTAAPKRKKAA